jgi:hypothetical protein
MATKRIVIHVDDEEVGVVLKTAKKEDGIWRAELMTQATKMEQSATSMVAFYLFPTCMASVKEPQWVRDMSLSDFVSKIDEPDIDTWVGEAYELNPQWKKSMRDLAELGEPDTKKSGSPSSGLTMPMEEVKKGTEISQPLKT